MMINLLGRHSVGNAEHPLPRGTETAPERAGQRSRPRRPSLAGMVRRNRRRQGSRFLRESRSSGEWKMMEVNNLFSQDYDVILNYPMPKRNYRFTLRIEL